MKFSNVRIGKKLGILIGSNLLLLVCLAAISLWAIREFDLSMDEAQAEGRRKTLALRVSSDVNGLAVCISNLVLQQRGSQDTLKRIAELRKSYQAAFEELGRMTRTDEGRRLLGTIEQVVARWKVQNLKITELTQSGEYAEAGNVYRQQFMPLFEQLSAATAEYLNHRDRRLQKLNEENEASHSQILAILLGVSLIAMLVGIGSGLMLSRSITRPLGATVNHLNVLAGGDVTRDVPQEQLTRGDEIGEVAKAASAVTVSLRDVLKGITSEIHVLSSSSAELSASSAHMSDGSRQASEKAHSVAAAAEQVSANVSTVAAGMEEAATNLSSVSVHTEQMTSTIGEIAVNSEKARHITEDATRQAARISEQMNQLGAAASEIGKVTETITEISSQTNLLALNATIEAARAGAAGKGFAVVANEIKELAQQTAAATEDIKSRIQGVQTSTAGGISEIEKVSQIVHEVSGIVSSIAVAIEEQATVTKDIAQNIAEASTGVKDVNQRVAETSQATREIAREIAVVDRAAIEIAEGNQQVNASALELSKSAEHLQALVSQFRVGHTDRSMLADAISAHSNWTGRLRVASARGKLDVPVSTIKADNQCQFGKWLYGKQLSDAIKQTEEYRTVQQLHAQFHEEASKVAQMALSGQREAAEKALNPSSDYCRISSALTAAINKWSTAL